MPEATILGCPKPPKPRFLRRKQRFLQTRRIRFRCHFGEACPPIRCLLGRIRLTLQDPFGALEPSKGSKVQLGRPAWCSKGANVLKLAPRRPRDNEPVSQNCCRRPAQTAKASILECLNPQNHVFSSVRRRLSKNVEFSPDAALALGSS